MGWFATYGPLGIFPIVNGGMTKMRPVFAPDVGAGLFKIMEDNVVGGVYEFAGWVYLLLFILASLNEFLTFSKNENI